MILVADGFDAIDWSSIVGNGIGQIVAAIIAVMALGRLILWAQTRLLDAAMKRTSTLEQRLEKVEKQRDEAHAEHLECREELSRHKIDAASELSELRISTARQISALSEQVAALTMRLGAEQLRDGSGWNNGPEDG